MNMSDSRTSNVFRGTKAVVLMILAIPALTGSAAAADGNYVNTFGPGGTVNHVEVSPADIQAEILQRVVSQVFLDGSVAMSGTRPHRISKFLVNGAPDEDFGIGGTTPAPSGDAGEAGTGFIRNGNGELFSLARRKDKQGDGVVLCRFSETGLPQNFASTGTPCVEQIVDTTSGSFWPRDLAMDATGGVLVASLDARIIRFRADGSTDVSLGTGGIQQIEPASTNTLMHNIERIKVVGNAIYAVGWIHDKDSGQTDGVTHKLRLTAQSDHYPVTEIVADPVFKAGQPNLLKCGLEKSSLCQLRALDMIGGDLVVTGSGAYDALYGVVLLLDGATGAQKGPVSVLAMSATPTTHVELNSIAAQHNGKVVVAGTLKDRDEAVVARLTPTCPNASDPGFNASGWLSFAYLVDAFSKGNAVSIGNGRIYVTGHTHGNVPNVESVSALLNSEAVLDGIFANDFEFTCSN